MTRYFQNRPRDVPSLSRQTQNRKHLVPGNSRVRGSLYGQFEHFGKSATHRVPAGSKSRSSHRQHSGDDEVSKAGLKFWPRAPIYVGEPHHNHLQLLGVDIVIKGRRSACCGTCLRNEESEVSTARRSTQCLEFPESARSSRRCSAPGLARARGACPGLPVTRPEPVPLA